VSLRIRWKTVGDKNTAGSRLRAFIPIRVLSSRGLNCALYNSPGDADIVIFQKTYTEQDISLAKDLRSSGKKVVLDLCDNHFYNPDDIPWMTERAQRLSRMIDVCHAVIVSSTELRRYVEHPAVFFVNDAVEDVKQNPLRRWLSRLNSSQRSPGKFSLVWFGNSGSEMPRFGMADIQKVIDPLNNIDSDTPLILNVISDSQALFEKYTASAKFETRFHTWRRENFSSLLSQNDVCIIPISLNPFTACKTANRVIVSLLCGVPVVADVIPSYNEFLPFIASGDWKFNIASTLKGSKDKVSKGIEYIHQHYNDERVVNEWNAVFKNL
jgi:hypothetical protein